MQLGFVSAILPDLSLEEVLQYASQNGFECVELLCWPVGAAERRYAGVTHIDVSNFDQAEATRIKALAAQYGITISALGYYPNPLTPDITERHVYVEHIKKMISASALLGLNLVNTFIGRDQHRAIEDQWTTFEEVWKPLVAFAEQQKVRIAIENCPMLFSLDEWPGGKNLAISPEIWRRMFASIPSDYFGLNFDPSHLIWQHIDYVRAIHEFKDKLFHVHAKDEKIDADLLYNRGTLGLKWHVPKLPGLGDVNWSHFFTALNEADYHGPVCIEVEDRDFEESLQSRQRALVLSKAHLAPFMK